MIDAVESAYLLLLGQISLIASSIFFGVPYHYILLGNHYEPPLKYNTIFFLIYTFSISMMLLINIIIGWSAMRDFLKNGYQYDSNMFIIDLFIIVVIFAMNNIIMFSFGNSFTSKPAELINELVKMNVSLEKISILNSSISFLTSIFLFLCNKWNGHYFKIINLDVNYTQLYSSELKYVIFISLLICVLSLYFRSSLKLQILFSTYLFLSWIFVNGTWIIENFLNKKKHV